LKCGELTDAIAWADLGHAIQVLSRAISSREPSMSRHHANLIRSIFHDPPSGNMHWREVEALLKHVGASLEPISGARIRVRLNRMEDVLHRPHHSNVLDAKSLLHVRGFLARAGITPSLYEAKGEGPA
jgi:hypothetical protein